MLGDRIHRARDAAGLSLRSLGQAVGVSQTAIANYESGKTVPSSDALLGLARACGVRVEYFLRPETRRLGRPEYRKRASLGVKAQRRIEADVIDQVERVLELFDLYPQPPVEPFSAPPGLPARVETPADLEGVAARLRDAWQLGQDPLPGLIATLEERGVLVFTTTVDEDGRFDGLAASVDAWPVVVVGATWPGDRQRFTLAHELGHLLLRGRCGDGLDEERACNRFAGALLAPAAAVRAELGDRRTRLDPGELLALKHQYGLSLHGWVYRAKDLGILSEAAARDHFVRFSIAGWRTREPGEPVPSERPGLFERWVRRALAEEWIGESKAAELLGRPVLALPPAQVLDAPAHQ